MKSIGLNLTIVIITAILCITAIELVALYRGINGVLSVGTIGIIAGIPAWFAGKKIAEVRLNKEG